MLTFWNGSTYGTIMFSLSNVSILMVWYLKVHTCASLWVMPLSFLLTVGMVFSQHMDVLGTSVVVADVRLLFMQELERERVQSCSL